MKRYATINILVVLRLAALLLAALAPLAALQAQSTYATPYTFTTLAGSTPYGSADGTGTAARFDFSTGVAVDDAGNVYVADTGNCTIRKITSAGVVTTLAGIAGSSGSTDGTGSAALFNRPSSVAVDGVGNVYVADTNNHTIRKITSAGVVTTLAGTAGSNGSTDGTGSAARFNYPSGVAVDGAGNVYVADSSNNTIRKVTSAGVVTTLAGTAIIAGSTDDTGSAARFNYPTGVAVDDAGNVYVVDTNNNTIRKITSAGVVATLAGSAGSSGSIDGTGSAAQFHEPDGGWRWTARAMSTSQIPATTQSVRLQPSEWLQHSPAAPAASARPTTQAVLRVFHIPEARRWTARAMSMSRIPSTTRSVRLHLPGWLQRSPAAPAASARPMARAVQRGSKRPWA